MKIGRSLGMTIHRQIGLNDTNRVKALERMSSGLRINRAADDAGGLALSETFTSQVRGTRQAMRNVQEGINMLRTAEGGFSTIHSVLQRMRELTVQGANGTLTLADRLGIQAELEELKQQVDTTAFYTSYNTLKVMTDQDSVLRQNEMPYSFLGSTTNPDSVPAPLGVWAGGGDSAAYRIAMAGGPVNGVTAADVQAVTAQLPFLIEGALRKAEGMLFTSGLDHSVTPPNIYLVIDPSVPTRFVATDQNNMVLNLYSFFNTGALPPGTQQVTLQQTVAQGMADLLLKREDLANGGSANAVADLSSPGAFQNIRLFHTTASAESYGGIAPPASFQFDTLDADSGRGASAWFSRYMLETFGQSSLQEISRIIVQDPASNKASYAPTIAAYLSSLHNGDTMAQIETTINAYITANPLTGSGVTSSLANTGDVTAMLLGPGFDIQVGANAGEIVSIDLYAGALGNIDFTGLVAVTDQTTATRSIATLDKAIAIVSSARAGLGAQENILEHTLNRLGSYENEAAATLSRIKDADMAREVSQLSRAHLLGQAQNGTLLNYHQIQRDQAATLLEGSWLAEA